MNLKTNGREAAESGLKELNEGNRRYVSSAPTHPRQDVSRREGLLSGQNPFAVVIACSDSRVPVEIIFDCGLGDLFVIRAAGHILDEAALASAQYAVEHLGTPLIVVLGHSNCGAVKSVVEGVHADGHLGRALEKLKPIVSAAAAHGGGVDAAVNANVENSVAVLKALPWAAGIKIVGMRYELTSGAVTEICR